MVSESERGQHGAPQKAQADLREPDKQENLNHYCVCLTSSDLPADAQSQLSQRRAAVLKYARWQPGDIITIRFLEGSPALQEKVRKAALEWTDIANLNFEFVTDGPADIRIAFVQGNGSWSWLGTMCREHKEPEPTMNYGWLTDASDEAEIRRVVLHEFGHALGLIHEHQNPKHPIQWNKPAVYHDLGGPPNNWSPQIVDNNMFKLYEKSQVLATDLDPKSIMMYPIPRSWTLDGFSAGLNGELSDEDKDMIRSVYPR